jgi:hypothetical protein
MREQLAERAERIALRHLIAAPAPSDVLARFRLDVLAGQ